MTIIRRHVPVEGDSDKDGRQTGFLRLPHSVDRSAYGWIPIPIVCLRNGDGPRVLLMAGNHGDKFEGQVALAKLARNLQADEIKPLVALEEVVTAGQPAALVHPVDTPWRARHEARRLPVSFGHSLRPFSAGARWRSR